MGNKPKPAKAVAHEHLVVIEVAEPHLLEMLSADRQLGGLIQHRLSPTVALVQAGEAETVIRHLRRLGHFPRVATGAQP